MHAHCRPWGTCYRPAEGGLGIRHQAGACQGPGVERPVALTGRRNAQCRISKAPSIAGLGVFQGSVI